MLIYSTNQTKIVIILQLKINKFLKIHRNTGWWIKSNSSHWQTVIWILVELKASAGKICAWKKTHRGKSNEKDTFQITEKYIIMLCSVLSTQLKDSCLNIYYFLYFKHVSKILLSISIYLVNGSQMHKNHLESLSKIHTSRPCSKILLYGRNTTF